MAKIPNAVEILRKNFNRLSRAHERYRRQTTDRQTTDGRAIAYSEREREFTFANDIIVTVNDCQCQTQYYRLYYRYAYAVRVTSQHP